MHNYKHKVNIIKQKSMKKIIQSMLTLFKEKVSVFEAS
jgi:hypothetical protein